MSTQASWGTLTTSIAGQWQRGRKAGSFRGFVLTTDSMPAFTDSRQCLWPSESWGIEWMRGEEGRMRAQTFVCAGNELGSSVKAVRALKQGNISPTSSVLIANAVNN